MSARPTATLRNDCSPKRRHWNNSWGFSTDYRVVNYAAEVAVAAVWMLRGRIHRVARSNAAMYLPFSALQPANKISTFYFKQTHSPRNCVQIDEIRMFHCAFPYIRPAILHQISQSPPACLPPLRPKIQATRSPGQFVLNNYWS